LRNPTGGEILGARWGRRFGARRGIPAIPAEIGLSVGPNLP
jgi:hypothetical protein